MLLVNSLVFSGGDFFPEDGIIDSFDPSLQAALSGPSTAPGPQIKQEEPVKQEEPSQQHDSIYVRVFEEMLSTVLQYESHLFVDEELHLFSKFANLSYNARFLVVKLLLRKPATWYRLDNLKYENELGGPDAIIAAIDEICAARPDTPDAIQDLKEECEVVDLTLDEETSQSTEAISGHNLMVSDNSGDSNTLDTATCRKLDALAENENEMDLEDLLDCLKTDELKSIAKQFQLKPNGKKKELIAAMLRAASSQSTLAFLATGKRQSGWTSTTYIQTTLPFAKEQRTRSQLGRLREVVHNLLVKCVRISNAFYDIVQRTNLVFFRLTQYTPDLLVTALLPRFKKRVYPVYEFIRSNDVWETREDLLKYEEALILEGRIDAILAGKITPDSHEYMPSFLSTPVKFESAGDSAKRPVHPSGDGQVETKHESPRLRNARLVKEIFDSVYSYWQALLNTKPEQRRSYGLERFESGHVLTRIVCKGSNAFGILGEHQRELEVLEALISQNRWRRGWRGRWHERRALILSTHFPKNQDTTERALTAVIEALEDPDTHVVYRSKLHRRLIRLEKRLKLSSENCHTSDAKPTSAKEVIFIATRIKHRAAGLALDKIGRNKSRTPTPRLNHGLEHYYKATTPAKSEANETGMSVHVPESLKQSGKTIWAGHNGEELTVEALALQRYEGQGYKGIHCETRIIVMLFGLLFWDIVFAPIPGAFETPYQTAPLDIAEDSFYHSRKDLMETRLSEIQNGKAADIIARVDCTHRGSGTWCVGVQWDLVNGEDLVDIVKCIGGDALSVICRVLCEDYGARLSGGPDLFLWNAKEHTCKFVEVKGPGDTLQENQKVWIDVLLRAPVPVEICRVVEHDEMAKKCGKPRQKGQKPVVTPDRDDSTEWDGGVDVPTTFLDLPQTSGRRSTRSSSWRKQQFNSSAVSDLPSNGVQHQNNSSKRKRTSPFDHTEDVMGTPLKKRAKVNKDYF